MRQSEDHAKQLEGLRKQIGEFADAAAEQLTRPELGAELDFRQLADVFDDVINVSRAFRESPLEQMPYWLLTEASSTYSNLAAAHKRIREFSIASGQVSNPLQHRNQLIGQFQQEANKFISQIAPTVAYARSASGALLDQRVREAERQIERARQGAEAVESIKNEAENLLRAAKDATKRVGIAEHAAHFAEQAAEHKRMSYVWLGAVAAVALLTALAAWYNYQAVMTGSTPLGGLNALQVGLAKLILFSLLFAATIWCGKVYRAHRHNYVVNRHRQNALSSFEAFAASTTDEQAKNAVLLQATQSIFAPQNTGYVASEGETLPQNQIIELIRGSGAPRGTS